MWARHCAGGWVQREYPDKFNQTWHGGVPHCALQEPCSLLPWPAAKLDSPSLLVPLTAKGIWAVKVGTISRLGVWKPPPSLDPLHDPLPCHHPYPATPPHPATPSHPIWRLDFSIYSTSGVMSWIWLNLYLPGSTSHLFYHRPTLDNDNLCYVTDILGLFLKAHSVTYPD